MKFSAISLRINEEKFFKVTAVGVCIGVLVCGFISVYFLMEAAKNIKIKKQVLEKTHPVFTYEAIATGPMTLNPHLFFRSVPSLLQELAFIRSENPPGLIGAAPFLMGIKNSKQLYPVQAGESVFLYMDEAESSFPKLRVSQTPTSLSIKPLLVEKNGILIEACLGGELEHHKAVNLLIREQSFSEFNPEAMEKFEKKLCVQFLKKAKCWGVDSLYQQYSGDKLAPLKTAMKLEVPHENRSLFFLLKEGDFLFFEANHWKKCETALLPSSVEKAEIIAIKPEGFEMAVWDESGYLQTHFLIPLSTISAPSSKESFLPTVAHLHSPSKISCLLGKKRIIVKKGDWLLKNSGGWRVLRTSQDIEDCLEHRRKGELFILDDFEVKNSQVILVGHHFDEMRTKSDSFQIGVDIPKSVKSPRSAKKKPLKAGNL